MYLLLGLCLVPFLQPTGQNIGTEACAYASPGVTRLALGANHQRSIIVTGKSAEVSIPWQHSLILLGKCTFLRFPGEDDDNPR